MPVACENCGTMNRAGAMFCIGCAGKLSTFVPSGTSALDALKASRLDARGQPRSRQTALPSETPMFWLRLVGFAFAAVLAFFAWYFLVVRTPASMLPADRPRAETHAAAIEAPPRQPSETVPPSRPPGAATTAPSTTAPSSAAPSKSVQATATKPAAQPAPKPQATAPQAKPEVKTEAPAPSTPSPRSTPPTKTAEPSATVAARAEQARPSRAERTERAARNEPQPTYEYRLPDELVSPSAAQPRGPDLGPPIAPSPPPRYASQPPPVQAPQASRALAPDLGPPIAPSPGPRVAYEATSAARAPDLGPPIAPSPRPRVAYEATSVVRAPDLGPPIAPSPGPTPSRTGRVAGGDERDPIRACANLDYLSMKSCERAQCAKPEFRSHPRCESARVELEERDAARRALARGG